MVNICHNTLMKTLLLAHVSPKMRGTFYCIASGSLFGLMGIFATGLYAQHFTIPNVLFWRFFIATLWLTAYRQFTKTPINTTTSKHASFLKVILLASFAYSSNTLFYFIAAKSIGTGIAMVIFFTFPAIVTFHSWLTGKWVLNAHGILAIGAVIIGMFLLEGMGGNALNTVGVLCSLVAACFYAGYIIVSKNQMHVVDPLTMTLFTCLGNTVFFLIMSFYKHVFIFPDTWSAWLYIAAFGILSTAMPIQLLLTGVRYIGPTKASLLSVAEPIMMVMIGVWFLGEKITILQWVGVMAMLAGAILIQFEKPSGETEPVMV